MPVASVTAIVTSPSSPTTADKSVDAAPVVTRSATAPVIPLVNPTVAFVTPAKAAASSTAVASDTVTVLAAPRATPSVIKASVTCAAVPVIVCAFETVTAPVVAPPITDKLDAAIVPVASVTVTAPEVVIVEALIAAINSAAVPLSTSPPSSTEGLMPEPPPPHAARGNKRTAVRPFLFFFATFSQRFRTLTRSGPDGIFTRSSLAPVASAKAETESSEPNTLAERSCLPSKIIEGASDSKSLGLLQCITNASTASSSDPR